jgi:hypothetical protein
MDDAKRDPVRARMMAMTDDELERVVTVDVDDWQPEAREVARQEMERRNIVGVAPFREAAIPRTQVPAAGDRRRPLYPKGVPLFIIALLVLRVMLYLLRY